MNVEILAPGGSKEAVYAALHSGADAVYTGTKWFSARAYAENPEVDELCRILDDAHLRGKKIYLTVNTLLTEEELEGQLFELLEPLYEAGLDAVIVQDLGVLDLIHESFPGMDVHASTQMTLLTAETAELLKPYGVTRIVPARELTIREIAAMRKKTDMELEVFVHGALCYCYSGQCQMSRVIGGRSGNRGMCAQPCRLPYEVEGKKAGYVLSPRDMCTLAQAGDLIDAGVNSFKIEGRMKKPAYAAYTSYLYRIYADAHISGVPIKDRELQRDLQNLADIYNRGGFSKGYLFEPSKKNIVYPIKNGHFGVFVGNVERVTKNTVEYRTEISTNAQDVLEFRKESGERTYEYTVKEGVEPGKIVSTRYKKGSEVKPGQKVYRTRNNRLLREITQRMEEGRKGSRIAVEGTFTGKCGEEVTLETVLGDKRSIVCGIKAERASAKPVSPEDVEKRLRRTGDSLFYFNDLKIQMDEQVFLPLGSIAALRRKALESLEKELLKGFHRVGGVKNKGVEPTLETYEPVSYTLIQVTRFRQIEGVKSLSKVNAKNARLHFKLDEFFPEEWERLNDLAGDFSYYISLPAVLREKNKEIFFRQWEQYGGSFLEGKCAGIILSSIEGLSVVPRIQKEGWELLADPNLYVWNRRAVKGYRRFGIRGHIYQAYGRTPVMVTEGCVNMGLGRCEGKRGTRKSIDISTPKKDKFTVVNYCNYCYNVIYEKNPGWSEPEVFANIPEIRFTFEDKEEVRKVLEQWNFLS